VKRGQATGRTALLGGALGLALAAALLGPGAAAGLVPARGDLADFFWPMKAYTAARWAAGSLALWNPLSGCGEPWLAQLQTGVLNPGDLPFLLGGAAGPLLAIALHVAIAAAGMAAWLSSLGVSRAGALAGAATWAGGGAFLSLAPVYNNFATAAFLPWLFLGARRTVRGSSPAFFAAAVALAFLGGEPALAAAGSCAAVAVAVASRGEEPAGAAPRPLRAALRAAGGLALGLGLAAAVLGPFLVLVTSTGRIAGATRSEALARPVGRADLADLAVPPAPRETQRPAPGRGGYLLTLALGPLPFVLAAAAGAGLAARPRLLVCLAALAALGVVLSLGARAGLVPLLWDGGLARGVRFPARWFVFAHFAFAAATGAGFDGWRDGHLLAWPKRAAHEAAPPAKGPLLVSATLAAGALALVFSFAAAEHRTPGVAAWAAFAAAAAGCGLLWRVRAAGTPSRGHGGALLVLCVALPLPLGARDVFAGVPASDLARPPRAVADLARGSAGRVFPVVSDGALLETWLRSGGGAWTADTARRAHEALSGYGSLPLGLASAASPSPIGNPWRTRLLGAALSGGDAGALLGLADVHHVVTPFPAAMPGSRLERRSGEVLRYGLERPLGRVFFAREAAVLGDDEAFRALSERTFDPEERALVAPGEGALPSRRAAKGFAVAHVTRDEPEAFEVGTATSEATTLVVTRSWDSGWEARLDGARVPLRRCDLALMAVAVPAGEHRLSLSYRPVAFRAGAAVSGASLLVLCALVLAGGKEDGP
jgi:hypothetical protein